MILFINGYDTIIYKWEHLYGMMCEFRKCRHYGYKTFASREEWQQNALEINSFSERVIAGLS